MARGTRLFIRVKWALVICLMAVHPVLLYLMLPVFGEGSNVIVLAAPVVATMLFNWRVGVVFTLLNVFISGFVFSHLTGMSSEEGRPKAVFSAIVVAIVCFGAEKLRIYIEQRKAMEAELHQARKMEAIGRLAGGVAHDMNNTLNAIMGSVFAHRQELAANGGPFKDLDNIVAACERGAQLTQNLLGFARKSHYKRQTFSLNGVVESVQALLIRTANKNIRMDIRLADGQPLIKGDRGQIENAVINLCLNALDAMGDRGTLTITTKAETGNVSICVTDTGTGMDDSVRERVFEPFFTTKADGKGTGLGLSMVYGVVHAMNGRITLESAPGEGTAFTLIFTRAAAAAAAAEPDVRLTSFAPDAKEALGYLGGRIVLLIDDEPLVLRAGVRMLSTLGCEVRSAQSGKEGVEIFRAHKGAIHLVIVDLMMPDMDGIATLKEILEIDEATPVLLVSGYTRESDKMEALKERHATVGFLAKPYQPDQLIIAVKNLLYRNRPQIEVSRRP